jgi:hypothetical protein
VILGAAGEPHKQRLPAKAAVIQDRSVCQLTTSESSSCHMSSVVDL